MPFDTLPKFNKILSRQNNICLIGKSMSLGKFLLWLILSISFNLFLLCSVKSIRIWSYSGLCFPAFRLNTRISLYSVRMLENTDQNNSEYGHFLRSVMLLYVNRFLLHSWYSYLEDTPWIISGHGISQDKYIQGLSPSPELVIRGFIERNSTETTAGVFQWIMQNFYVQRGVAKGAQLGGIAPPASTSKPKKVQKFLFQTSGILFFMSV